MVLQAVKNGDFAADVLQFPDAMGIIGVDLMVRHLNGEDVPERVDSGSGLATAENVDQYLGSVAHSWRRVAGSSRRALRRRSSRVAGQAARILQPSHVGVDQDAAIFDGAMMTEPLRRRYRPVLELRGISKRFPGVVALDDVAFDLRAGEVHVLVGENGAGKSTLVKILSGIYQPDAGEILLDGKPVTLPDPHAAQQLGISTVHQELNLVPHLDVGRNMYLGREPLRGAGVIDWPALYRGASAQLAALGMSFDPHTQVRRPRSRPAADDGDRQGARRQSARLDPR